MGRGDRPANCASCNKRLSRKSWYYRHGKYYCTKRCWTKDAEKAAQEAAAPKADAQAPVAAAPAGPKADQPAQAPPGEAGTTTKPAEQAAS